MRISVMTLISISKAAELTGKSIPTIYQHIQEGKLSVSNDKVNTSELIKLYGALKTSEDCRRENEFLHNLTLHLKRDKERLYQINDLLRKSNEDLKQEKDKLYRIIDQQNSSSGQMRQIYPNIKTIDNPIKIERYQENDKESLTQRLFRKLFNEKKPRY